MHLTDGVVDYPTCIGGAAIALGMCGLAARNVRDEEIPRIALLTAAFFVASLVHFPVGGTSVHLIFNGLVGVLLGFRAFLVFPVGLALQALLLQHGGVTVIGVNACIFGFPAWAAYGVFCLLGRSRFGEGFAAGSFAGGLGVIFSGLILAAVLYAVGEQMRVVAQYTLLCHLVVAVFEGIVTGFCVRYLSVGRPHLLRGSQP